METVERDGVRWTCRKGFGALPGRVVNSGFEVIKESPAKLVTRHQLNGSTFFVKRYRNGRMPLRRLKYFFKKSPARSEWQMAHRLISRGVPLVSPLAFGERWSRRGLEESILISEGFDGIPASRSSNLDREEVLRLIEHLHEKGVLIDKIHAENLLVDPGTGRLCMVDAYPARIRPSLSPQARQDNLALLHLSLPLPVSRPIQERSLHLRRRLMAYRSRRCLRHNREFYPRRAGGLRWQLRRHDGARELEGWLEDPDAQLAKRALPLKLGRSVTAGALGGIVIKRFNPVRPWSRLKDLFRPSPAFREFRKAYHLELLGIPAVVPLAAAERRRWRLLRESYLITRRIAGAVTLDQVLEAGQAGPELVEALAGLLAALHEEGFSHRDLKASNIVLDASRRPHLADLKGLRFCGRVSDARAVRDLRRLERDTRARIPASYVRLFLRRYRRSRGRGTSRAAHPAH